GQHHLPPGEPEVGVVGTPLDRGKTTDTVGPADAADHHGVKGAFRQAGAQRPSVSTTSTRRPRPPTPVITWRSALAVRPPRPMTLPRSSGCTRTSRVLPRRLLSRSTVTSSGWSTIPLTRCSSASSSTSYSAGVSAGAPEAGPSPPAPTASATTSAGASAGASAAFF